MTAALAKPRPGSSIDKALRALESEGAPMTRAAIAALIEHDEEEVDGLLRYGVRMGLLVRSNGDEDVSYALGDGVPVEVEIRPAEPEVQPVPRGSAANLNGADDDDESDRGRARRLAGEGDTGAARRGRQRHEPERDHRAPEHEAGLLRSLAPRAAREGNAESVAPGPRIGCATYAPREGSKTSLALALLHATALHGGDAWLTARDFASVRIEPQAVQAMLSIAEKHQLVLRRLRDGRQQYQLGPAAVVMEAGEPKPVAQSTAPAPRRALDHPAPGPCPVTAEAVHAPPSLQAVPAQSVDIASFLLSQLDTEIARLEHNLRMVRRRKEAFDLALDGARLHSPSPQSETAKGAASVGWRT
jgi:hypothetical protein